jgi:hypothetical protein
MLNDRYLALNHIGHFFIDKLSLYQIDFKSVSSDSSSLAAKNYEIKIWINIFLKFFLAHFPLMKQFQ